MYAIHAELSADGAHVVLVAAGPDYAIAAAARRIRALTPLVRPTQPPGGLTLGLSWPAVIQLSAVFGDAWAPGPRLTGWIEAEISRRTAPADGPLEVPLPPGLTPYPWQRSGAHMIASVGSVLVTDEPRTGKSVTTILGLLERAHRGEMLVWPALVVAPASVVDPWLDEWRRWAPDVRTVAWRGSPAARRRLVGTADVYVASYDTARMDAPPGVPTAGGSPLLALAPVSVVVDECHQIKTSSALRSLAVRRLAKGARTVVALSGTPISHDPGDLWPTLVALQPDAWPSRERWINRYCAVVPGDYGDRIVGLASHHEAEFRATLLGGMRRVARADVLADLPTKTYSVRTVELPPAHRKVYDAMESRMLAELPDDGGEISVMSVLAQLTRLSQMASAAAVVVVTVELGEDGISREHQTVTLKAPSWKVDALLEVLAERPGDPTLCFAPSRQLTVLAAASAEKAGWKVGRIVGGQTPAERSANREAFQRGELDLLCATTGAGGVGLTLTRAGTVVFLQRPWSLVESSQAEDRAEGIGSETTNGTHIVDIVARDTIDSRVRSVLREKGKQLADLLQDPRILTELLGGTGTRKIKQKGKSS